MAVHHNRHEQKVDTFIYEDSDKYLDNCVNLFRKIRSNPNIHNPPLRVPPKEMKALYEKGDQMPITGLDYIDEAYVDASGNKSDKIHVISDVELLLVNDYVEDHENSGHGPKIIKQQMQLYNKELQGAHVLVVGSEQPWVEMIARNLGAEKIISLDYTRKKYTNAHFEWWHILDFLDFSADNKYIDHVDFAITYSTVQHAGLGKVTILNPKPLDFLRCNEMSPIQSIPKLFIECKTS